MISRRKFLAGAIAAAVAPSVAPELEVYQRRPGYQLAAMPLPFGKPISRIMPFNERLIAICDDRAFISGAGGWKEILPDFSVPKIERIDPVFDQRALYHFDQPLGKCPEESQCPVCYLSDKA